MVWPGTRKHEKKIGESWHGKIKYCGKKESIGDFTPMVSTKQ
jgi:hypothetical protein